MKINFYSGFNNYYNRKVIVHDSLADYQDYLLLTIPNVNFKPKDGINTDQIVNTTQAVDYQVFNLSNTPDYAIVADDDNTIISRWFVMQYDSLIYKNQYRAVLRRDVIADNYDAVIEAPVFVEKATITDKTDPAIFNSENMGFNQIKTKEGLLKDLSYIPWIVGYVPSTFEIEVGKPIQTEYNGDMYQLYDSGEEDGRNSPNEPKPISNMPFRMFCMPFADITVNGEREDHTSFQTTLSKDLTIQIASSIAETYGKDNVFDIQLLPYCPLRLNNAENTLKFILSGQGYVVTPGEYWCIRDTQESDTKKFKGLFYWCDLNKFSFDITAPGALNLSIPSTALEMKVMNETEMYRLCSPNYNGQFEFNPMKNGGVTKFNVDCMYQPFNPYIHINPDFGGLYGQDFDDARGLICQGDFSLPQENSAWANYQQNNKNFQNIFNRQIENMEFNNRIAMWSQGISAVTGAAQGAGTGAFIGSGMGTLGGPIGGTVGGVLSAGAGIADTILLASQQKETLDYTKDQFGYQMGNIKAMPNSITKTTPFTNNNKIFPIIEYYTCTTKEIQALKDKMKYNGMTIGRIGKIKDWLLSDYSYIKGKLIMLDSSIEEDYHTVVEIAQELDKGIRAKKEEE